MHNQLKLLLLLLGMMLFTFSSEAQEIQWEKKYETNATAFSSFVNGINAFIPYNSGFVLAGGEDSTSGNYLREFWIIRTDLTGDTIWTSHFGGSYDEMIRDVVRTKDGNILAVGFTDSENGDVSFSYPDSCSGECYDWWVIKVDPTGNLMWEKSYGGNYYDKAECVTATYDSGFVIGGRMNDGSGSGDGLVMKIDKNGTMQWQKKFEEISFDVSAVGEMSNKDILVSVDDSLVRFDKNGNVKWRRPESHQFLHEKSPNEMLLAGIDSLKSTDSLGNQRWKVKTPFRVREVYPSIDTGYMLVGTTPDSVWIGQMDPSENFLWEFYLRQGEGVGVFQDSYGDIYASGDNARIRGEGWLIKASPPIRNEICLVSVDSTSSKNIIEWKEHKYPWRTDSVRIYRDIASVYQPIGKADYSAPNFVDPNVNPQNTAYRYKISLIDTSGTESALSDHHKTIHLAVSEGQNGEVNLDWTDYIGFTYSYYRILRAPHNTYNWQVIDSVGSGITSYTDNNPISDTADYLIEVVHPGCSGTNKRGASRTLTSTRSNMPKVKVDTSVGVKDQRETPLSIKTYPNPSSGKVTIETTKRNQPALLVLSTIEGKLVMKAQITKSVGLVLRPGIYILRAKVEDSIIHEKLVVN